MKTYLVLLLNPRRLGAYDVVRGEGKVVPHPGQHSHVVVGAYDGDHARVMLPNQKAQDAIDLAYLAGFGHNFPIAARVIKKNY